jgi:hypothetical protein
MSWNGHVIETERCAGYVALVEFLFVFDALDAEEGEAEKHGQDEAANHQGAPSGLSAPNGEHHGQAAADEDRRVRGAKAGLNRGAGGSEISKVQAAVNQIGAEQSAEEHDFGSQEDPHTEAGGIALLLRFGEVVQQFGMMLLLVVKADDSAIRQL